MIPREQGMARFTDQQDKKRQAYSDSTDVELFELSDPLRGRLWVAPV
jgi:hypothetical protein